MDLQTTALAVEICGKCGLPLDLRETAPLSVVSCPGCQEPKTVLQNFGPFALDELIGEGGMGSVYRAKDRSLQRSVALKVLQRALSHNAALAEQFQREAALAARVNHPNVVHIYSSGICHGMFYIAMELVDQGSLDALMSTSGKVDEATVLRIGIGAAEGLAAAYRAGLVHRDIKPGNILFGPNQEPKIADFGLALHLGNAGPSKGEIWGTPFYIAPESLVAYEEDFRSDLYALGATLWHAIAGKPPLVTESTSLNELFRLKQQKFDLAKDAPDAHPLTVATLNRAISFEPEDRHPGYTEFVTELRQALAAIEAAKLKKKPRSLPAPALAAAAVLVLAGGGLFWLRRAHPKAAPPQNPQVQQALATESAPASPPAPLPEAASDPVPAQDPALASTPAPENPPAPSPAPAPELNAQTAPVPASNDAQPAPAETAAAPANPTPSSSDLITSLGALSSIEEKKALSTARSSEETKPLTVAPSPEKKNPVAPLAPSPEERMAELQLESSFAPIRAAVLNQLRSLQFEEALRELNAAPNSTEKERAMKARLHRQIADASALFVWVVGEINRGSLLPVPTLKDPQKRSGMAISANLKTLTIRDAKTSASVTVGWDEVSPQFLMDALKIRLATSSAAAPRLDLLWAAGNFRTLLGEDDGRVILQRVAKLEPRYAPLLQQTLEPAHP